MSSECIITSIRSSIDIMKTKQGENMTIATKPTTLRIDEDVKREATDILESMGISFNGYLNMAIRQLINQHRIPFDIVPAHKIPNEETRRAMLLAEAKAMGLIEDDAVTFENADDALAYLEAL